jgi:hypothetical protein
MIKKVNKDITIKEIADAFYAGVSPDKLKKMLEMLVKQNGVVDTKYSINNRFDR